MLVKINTTWVVTLLFVLLGFLCGSFLLHQQVLGQGIAWHHLALFLTKEVFVATLFGLLAYFYQKSRQHSQNIAALLATERAILASTVTGILLLDRGMQVITYNTKCAQIWGISPNKKTPFVVDLGTLFAKAAEKDRLITYVKTMMGQPEKPKNLEIALQGGQHLEITCAPIYSTLVTGCVFSFHDVTRRKQAADTLLHLAQSDPLTGLNNRSLLAQQLVKSLSEAKRYAHKIALLFFDLNGFKSINDRFGHHVGDQLLRALAKRWLCLMRESDTLARMGGDEFVLLARNVTCAADIRAISSRYQAALQKPFQLCGHVLRVSCSIGVSWYPEDGTDADQLLQNADTALYLAKKQKSGLQFYGNVSK